MQTGMEEYVHTVRINKETRGGWTKKGNLIYNQEICLFLLVTWISLPIQTGFLIFFLGVMWPAKCGTY